MNRSGNVVLLGTLLWCAFGGMDSALSAPQSDGTATATGKWVRIEPKPVEIDGQVYSPTCSQASGSDAT